MPTWLEAGLWGLLGGGALVLGALVAWFARVPKTAIAPMISQMTTMVLMMLPPLRRVSIAMRR